MATPVSRLHELAAQQKLEGPLFSTVSRTGPPHAPIFRVQVSFAGFVADAESSTVQAAKHCAAERLLDAMASAQGDLSKPAPQAPAERGRSPPAVSAPAVSQSLCRGCYGATHRAAEDDPQHLPSGAAGE